MARKANLGIFWGNDAFHFVESTALSPTKVFSAPFDLSESIEGPESTGGMEGVKYTAIIQKVLRDQKLSTSNVSLSLPTKDIIFRSFIIPWMQSAEIKGVVDFEVTKYIPFKLNELSYTYHAATFTENKKKSIRILFVGVRKDTLDNYCGVLEHSGLTVEEIEPAPLSLVRALVNKKQIPRNQTIAVIEADNKEGRIIIVDSTVPQFVREFQLLPSGKTAEEQDPDLVRIRLFNEIRISLDYYGREYTKKKIDKIFIVTNENTQELSKTLNDDLSISATPVDINSILNTSDPSHPGLLNAYGVSIKSHLNLSVDFNLPRKVAEEEEEEEGILPEEKIINYKLVAGVALGCIGVIFLTFIFSSRMISNYKIKESSLSSQLGPFASSSKKTIDEQTEKFKEKLADYKSIRTRSDVSQFLLLVPKLLPDGTWLQDLNIQYTESSKADTTKKTTKILLSLYGFAYLEDTNQQFRLVNKFVANLRNNKEFSDFFSVIKLGSLNTQNFGGFPVTTFNIDCQ